MGMIVLLFLRNINQNVGHQRAQQKLFMFNEISHASHPSQNTIQHHIIVVYLYTVFRGILISTHQAIFTFYFPLNEMYPKIIISTHSCAQ
jgi:hypothetical protein